MNEGMAMNVEFFTYIMTMMVLFCGEN